METLPFELLERIFTCACTDNGRTGCALSAVSHHIRDASAPMRYHSIALIGARQIRTFIQLLYDPSPKHTQLKLQLRMQNWIVGKIRGTKPKSVGRTALSSPVYKIRHLFLADTEGPVTPPWDEWMIETPAERPRQLNAPRPEVEVERCDFSGESWRPMKTAVSLAEATIANLLTRVSPTLEHLCYHQILSSSALFTVHFPVLVELTCHLEEHGCGEYVKRKITAAERGVNLPARDTSVNMPALERLHAIDKLDGGYNDICRLMSTLNLPASLSLVYFSNVTNPGSILAFLFNEKNSPWVRQNRFNILVSRHAPPSSRSTRPAQLHRAGSEDSMTISAPSGSVIAPIHEHTISFPNPESWLPPRSWYNTCSGPDLHAIISKIRIMEDPEEYGRRRLYQEWISRVQGQEGCWKDEGIPLSLMMERG
jgi:hypothetical protein